MQDFGLYLGIGFDHILDPNGYDHILFIISLCCVYRLVDWDRVLVLVTAFTIGHSVTLALAVLDVFSLPAALVEQLIPVTIIITAFSNLFFKTIQPVTLRKGSKWRGNYFFALFFGLIHGMGFSNYLRSILISDNSILGPLFGFNVGLELAQIVIVITFLMLSFLVLNILKVNRREWIVGVSSAIIAVSVVILAG